MDSYDANSDDEGMFVNEMNSTLTNRIKLTTDFNVAMDNIIIIPSAIISHIPNIPDVRLLMYFNPHIGGYIVGTVKPEPTQCKYCLVYSKRLTKHLRQK